MKGLGTCSLNPSVAFWTPSKLCYTNAMKCCKVKAARSQFQNSFFLQAEIGDVKKQAREQKRKNKINGQEVDSKGYFHRSTKYSLECLVGL